MVLALVAMLSAILVAMPVAVSTASACVLEKAAQSFGTLSGCDGQRQFLPLGIYADADALGQFRQYADGRRLELRIRGSDRHRIALAELYFADDDDDDGESLQLRLLREGRVRVFARSNFDGLAAMLAAEEYARGRGLGKWRDEWRLADGENMPSFSPGFAIVEGTISGCKNAKRGRVLVMGERRNRGFRALVLKPIGAKKRAKCVLGERLRLRGFLENFDGAFMTVADPCLIEVQTKTGKPRLRCESTPP